MTDPLILEPDFDDADGVRRVLVEAAHAVAHANNAAAVDEFRRRVWPFLETGRAWIIEPPVRALLTLLRRVGAPAADVVAAAERLLLATEIAQDNAMGLVRFCLNDATPTDVETPTAPHRRVQLGQFGSVTEALDFAALGETGMNLYSLRGQLDEALTYRALRRDALVHADRLLSSGLRPGDAIGLVAETDGAFIRAWFAAIYAGLIPLPLPLPAPLGGRASYAEMVSRMLGAAGAKGLIASQAMIEHLNGLSLEGMIVFGTLSDLSPPLGNPLPDIAPSRECYAQFSSGSTRTPAGVVITHQALIANVTAIAAHGLKVTSADRALCWLPLYHDMGLVGFVMAPMACQMSVDLLPTGAFVRRPLLWLDLISRNGVTITYAPTFGYELSARRAQAAALDVDLSALRVAGVGGDLVQAARLEAFGEAFERVGFSPKAFVASYGLAEATLAVSIAPLDTGFQTVDLEVSPPRRSSTARPAITPAATRAFMRCGPPLPGLDVDIRNEDGKPVRAGEIGEVFVRGPSLMHRFLMEDARPGVLRDGWLATGDLGFLHGADLVLTGRDKDLIILNGRNLWPEDLEWTLETELPELRSGDVAAFAASTEDGDEIVIVLIQCRTRDSEERAALAANAKTLLGARHGVEARVELVGANALPMTSSGKLKRAQARETYLGNLAYVVVGT